jgi:hypothetical protein
MSAKLTLAQELAALDTKDRGFYDELTDEERKKFSTYLMMKYAASVEGNRDLQEWYLRAQNDRVNQDFFAIGRHPKLQWLLCTSVSPDMGRQKHYWMGSRHKTNPIQKVLAEQFPDLNREELAILVNNTNRKDLEAYLQSLGWDDKEIRNAF